MLQLTGRRWRQAFAVDGLGLDQVVGQHFRVGDELGAHLASLSPPYVQSKISASCEPPSCSEARRILLPRATGWPAAALTTVQDRATWHGGVNNFGEERMVDYSVAVT